MNPLPPSAIGKGCRHIGNNKPAFSAAKRNRRNRIATLSRRRKKAKAAVDHGGFRSGLEARLVPPLLARGATYEPVSLKYPAAPRKYIPDVILDNGIALEIKGWFTPADRTKMLAVKAAYPLLDVRMVLQAPFTKLNKKSNTTLAAWCEKYGFKWSNNEVPEAWLNEPINLVSADIILRGQAIVRKKRVRQLALPLEGAP